jgi:MOSC domain-containing protein YiiM
MKPLRERLLEVPQLGEISWIGVRPNHAAPMTVLSEVRALEGRGLDGDRAARAKQGGNRQVTLLQEEHLAVLASLTSALEVRPEQLRRNLLVSRVNLLALIKLRFAIGSEVVLVGTGPCAPCQKLEETLGPGGFQAARGHGGITARVERGGLIRLGDTVRVLPAPTAS